MSVMDGIVLLGPTGSGKTPLGELIQRRGLWGRACVHFDFGDRLRRIVAAAAPPEALTAADVDFVRSVLQTGALLEDEHFHIAEAIGRAAIAEARAGGAELIVLNGLPRHVGQAEGVDRFVGVRAVVALACTVKLVHERIASNAGGDRTERQDDDPASVRNKLAIYAERTAALEAHYRRRGVPIERVTVGEATRPADIWERLNARPLGGAAEAN